MPPTEPEDHQPDAILAGVRMAFFGRMASMSQREASALVRRHGATVSERPHAGTQLLVLGEDGLALGDDTDLEDLFEGSARTAVEQGSLEVITETQLWHRLGLVDIEQNLHRLYTPAMLAELLDVPLSIVRRWNRRGLIVPAREVQRLPYFDFQEVLTARRLAQLLSAGMSPDAIERKLATLARYVPDVARPLAQLSVIIEGKDILMRQGDGLIEPGGQRRFDFDAAEVPEPPLPTPEQIADDEQALALEANDEEPPSARQLLRRAEHFEEAGQLETAVELLRAALAASGPDPAISFQLAELLTRLGDLAAARERYYVVLEQEEDYVEARANLGCVLAEMGDHALAVAAFQGALATHPDYADVHYHLAKTLDAMGQGDEAASHWRAVLDLVPGSSWSDSARKRIASDQGASD